MINHLMSLLKPKIAGATQDDVDALYERAKSFTDLLPWVEYLTDSRCFLLEDGISVGAMFEVSVIATDAKTDKFLYDVEENLRSVLTHAIPQHDQPYVLQVCVKDEESLKSFGEQFASYIRPDIASTEFTTEVVKHMLEHLRRVQNPKGYFEDTGVTGGLWSGKRRRVKAFIYRRIDKFALVDKRDDEQSEEEKLNEVCEKFTSQLNATGISVRRCEGSDFWYWMLEWLNPSPAAFEGNIDLMKEQYPYPGDENLPYGCDFAKSLNLTTPESDAQNGCWIFDGVYHKAMTIENLVRIPVPGHLTGERKIGDNLYAVFDKLPAGTMLCFTITIKPQDTVNNHVTAIKNASRGEEAEAKNTAEDCEKALNIMSKGDNLYPVIITVFLRGQDRSDIRKKINITNSLLLANGLHAVDERDDQVPLDNYIKMMPMNYEPGREKKVSTARYMFCSHLARLLPFYGRETGTGNVGQIFFNRGGEPLSFDPLNKKDRTKNAFGLVLGPPGSGKSALMVYILLMFIAVYRPRVFIIEKGGSFTLFGEFCRKFGLTVNQKVLHPKNDVRLPPFAEALNMLLREEKKERALRDELSIESFVAEHVDDVEEIPEDLSEDDEDEEERDYLGEMELSARVMITGGDKKEEEKMSRSDRLLIRKAIVNAAIMKRAENDQNNTNQIVLTEDVCRALKDIGGEEGRRESSAERAYDMAEAMELFCQGTNGHFFNRPGEMWPECDVTIMEMGILANEGYEDGMALGFMSLMNIITAIVERDQFLDRPTIILGDEAHLFTTNPLLAPFIVKIVKMYRKLGAWLWLATQNLEDFPAESRKMLSMFEWFIAMTCPKEQVELIAGFRDLTVEQKSMLLAAHKESGKYTEGVVCASKLTALFRNVPFPLALSLAFTDKDEKAARALIAKEHGCSDIEAALIMAEQMGAAKEKGVSY